MPLGERARRDRLGELVGEQRERRLVERDVHDAADPGGRPFQQRRHDPERGPRPRALVDRGRADPHARPVGLAGDADDPAEGLHQRVVAGPPGERAVAPERADRAVDEALVAGAQLVGAEAEALGGAGPQALDEDVRLLGEPVEHVEPALHVEPERALAGVRREEHHAPPGEELRPPGPSLVAALRVLDLDDIGSERAQDLRAVRAGQRRRHVDHLDPRERPELHCARAYKGRVAA